MANKNKNDINSYKNNNENTHAQFYLDYGYFPVVIDNLDRKLLDLLLRGYENKRIATELKAPLSTIQRRTRKIFESHYFNRKNELNYKKLGLRKGYLQISVKGGRSHTVAEKLVDINGITSVSEATGSFDILCDYVFRDSDELFNMMEYVKTIERVNNVAYAEEAHSLLINEDEKIARNVITLL